MVLNSLSALLGTLSPRNFVDQSYPPAPTFTDADVAPGSQKGRVFIVTGGNSGIGFELTKVLYKTGATIYMATRSQERAEAAIKTIVEAYSTADPSTRGALKFIQYDLNDLESVKAAAAAFAQQESKLDVLWNNAGQGGNRVKPGQRTAQDLEPMVGMHCVATLFFTVLLLPQLRVAAAAEAASEGGRRGRTRVLFTSSGVAEVGSVRNGINFAKLDKGTGDLVKNYGNSKAGTWILGREFARRYGCEGILSLVVNPGNVRANSWEGTAALMMWVFHKVLLYNTHYGTYPQLYAGLSPDLTLEDNGLYIIPWGRKHPDTSVVRKDIIKASNPEDQGGLGYGTRFWEWCEAKWEPFM